MAVPTAPIVAGALVGGYLVARTTKVRALGGVVLAAGGAVAGPEWIKTAGPVGTTALIFIYLGSFGASHPLAKRIGPWPAVFTAAATSAAASRLLADRNA